MKKTLLILALLLIGIGLSGCAYVNIKTPYDTNLNRTELGTKQGRASSHQLLWLFVWGDGSYAAAAKNGNISVLKHADQELQYYLFGIYGRRTVIVYGD